MKLKNIRKQKHRIILLLFISLVVYIVGCCLIPPLLKNNDTDTTKLQTDVSSTERICIVDDNMDALLWRLKMIQEAQQEIILVTFELRDDTSGAAIMAALLEAADRGVSVRLLMDGVDGELRLHDSQNFKAFLSHENIEVKFYNPLRVTALRKVNYRLHDKYLIIDDTAYILGGRNTHDVYLGASGDDAQNDRDIVVYETVSSECNSLCQLRNYFETVWSMEECELLSSKMSGEKQKQIRKTLAEHLSNLIQEYNFQMTDIDWYSETIQANGITLLTGNPAAENKTPVVWKQLCRMMEEADDEVMILTPLIICDDAMYEDLGQICKGTADIQIITNALENNVNLLAANYPSQKRKTLEAGITISEYCGDKSLHTKTILIDENLSIIGSFNLDARSTYIDTEIMLVIDCPALNAALREQMSKMQEQSKIIAPDGSVSLGAEYIPKEMSFGRKCLNVILNIVLYPFQYLL